MLKTYLAVMVGGAAGTGARMWLSSALTLKYGENFPIGTIAVNVVGCLIIGCFNALTEPHGAFPATPLLRLVVMVGFLGGFTTFSAFSIESLLLLQRGHLLLALGHGVAHVAGALACAALGFRLAQLLLLR